MLIDMKSTATFQLDIDEIGALKLLCKTLCMDFVLDEDTDYFVGKDESGENGIYIKDGHDTKFDDRGDLFVALRNVAVNIVPNVLFRSADYIYKSD